MFFSNKLLFQHLWLHLILYYRRKVGFPCGLLGESSKDDYKTVWEVESAQTECPCVCHDLCIAYKSISITSGYVSGSIKYKHKGQRFFKQDVKCETNWLCGCCLRFDLDNHYWQDWSRAIPGGSALPPAGCTRTAPGTVAARWASLSAHWGPTGGLWTEEPCLETKHTTWFMWI